jgi:hypothetical protein
VSVIVPPESARARFLRAVVEQLGKPVVWAAKAPDAFDCSEVVSWGLYVASGGKLKHSGTHTAARYHDETRPLPPTEIILPGDLCFHGIYVKDEATGDSKLRVIHVTVCEAGEGVISADGATSAITSLEVAMANPANRVRRHPKRNYRKEPYFSVHRNVYVDDLDRVTR